MKSLKELAQQALDVQNACNLCGVAQSFAQAMIGLGEHVQGTTNRNNHPITLLWIDKMASLAGIQSYGDLQVDAMLNQAFRDVTALTETEWVNNVVQDLQNRKE